MNDNSAVTLMHPVNVVARIRFLSVAESGRVSFSFTVCLTKSFKAPAVSRVTLRRFEESLRVTQKRKLLQTIRFLRLYRVQRRFCVLVELLCFQVNTIDISKGKEGGRIEKLQQTLRISFLVTICTV